MNYRRFLAVLVFTLPIGIVLFAVLMGSATLADLFQDPVGSRALRWIAASVLCIIVVDAILLLGMLGLDAINRRDDSEPHE